MGKFLKRCSTLALLFLFGVALGWAQGQPQPSATSGQQSQQEPSSQSTATPTSPQQPTQQGTSAGQQTTSEPTVPESVPSSAPPLTGAERFALSRIGMSRSYFAPSFQFAQSVTTAGTSAFGTSTVEPVSTLSGVLAFHHLWSRYAFTAQYSGTGFIYNHKSTSNTSAHEFTLSQRVQGRRSTFSLQDVVTYLPESSFGYARFSGFNNYGSVGYGYGGLFGASGGNLDTTYLPSQSILTGPSSRVSNAVVGEYDYETSPLSSLTFTGSYALLRFPSSNFLRSDDAIFKIGFNHTFTRKNSMAVSYQAGIFRFGQTDGDFINHVASLTYRRSVSRRLALQLGAGPQINVYNNSLPGQNKQITWQGSAQLDYQLRRTILELNYWHYTSGGSGVYLGARTDRAGIYFSLPLSQRWTVDSDAGYSYNTTLQNGNLTGSGRSYNSWYGDLNLHRMLTPSMSMFLSYNLQQQLTPNTTCVGTICGTFYTQQYFSFGLNWHPVLMGIE